MSEYIDPDTLDWLAELGEVAEVLQTDPDALIWKYDHPAFRYSHPPQKENKQ